MSLSRCCVALSAILFTCFVAKASPRYTVIPLGDFGNFYTTANAINDAGQIIGDYTYSSDDGESYYPDAFLYNRGAIATLPSLGGDSTAASDIDASARIVGYSYIDSPGGVRHAFLYAGGTLSDLGTLGNPATASLKSSAAGAINSSGEIVGYSYSDDVGYHSFLYANGTMTRLPDFGGAYSSAADINDLGQIVGWANTAINDGSHAFLYSGGTLMDLGTLGGNESSATAINNRGEVVGSAEIKGSSYAGHAFLYAKRKMTDLGTLGGSNSSASSINDHGEIVGSSDVKKSRFPHAFIVSNGKMTDLNDLVSSNSKWVVQRAYRISNNGLIVGSGTLKGSYLSQALLLSPVPTLTILGGEKHTTGSHRIKIHGKVDASVAAVTYQQAGHHGTASGPLTRWHIVVSLHPGRNVITVTARGIGGNKISKKITIVRS